MKINRNMSAVRANKQLLGTENRLSKSMKRLSSGYKINSAEREFDTLKSKKVPQSLEIGLFFCQIFIFII